MTHDQLCERAEMWLRQNRRCEPVLSRVGSCAEIPDAIGWSSYCRNRGSIVVECKTSRSDFMAARMKYAHWVKGDDTFTTKGRTQKEMRGFGYELKPDAIECMGDYRFFLSPPDVLSEELIAEHRPDHGLLHAIGKKVVIVREAPRREKVSHASEVHYLRFALIHFKDNVLKHGWQVSLTEATKFFGEKGLTPPEAKLF